jgi:hypothetical protein
VHGQGITMALGMLADGAAVALSTTLGVFACGLRWASTAVNSNTLPEYFSYANLALKDNGFQKIHRNLAN